MKSFWNKLFQICATITQIGVIVVDIVPSKAKPYVVGSIAGAQGVASIVAHYYNPDGTPASVAYAPLGKVVKAMKGDY